MVSLSVVMKDMKKLGYDVLPSDVQNPTIPDSVTKTTVGAS